MRIARFPVMDPTSLNLFLNGRNRPHGDFFGRSPWKKVTVSLENVKRKRVISIQRFEKQR
jgi:hypothetical protein